MCGLCGFLGRDVDLAVGPERNSMTARDQGRSEIEPARLSDRDRPAIAIGVPRLACNRPAARQ